MTSVDSWLLVESGGSVAWGVEHRTVYWEKAAVVDYFAVVGTSVGGGEDVVGDDNCTNSSISVDATRANWEVNWGGRRIGIRGRSQKSD